MRGGLWSGACGNKTVGFASIGSEGVGPQVLQDEGEGIVDQLQMMDMLLQCCARLLSAYVCYLQPRSSWSAGVICEILILAVAQQLHLLFCTSKP